MRRCWNSCKAWWIEKQPCVVDGTRGNTISFFRLAPLTVLPHCSPQQRHLLLRILHITLPACDTSCVELGVVRAPHGVAKLQCGQGSLHVTTMSAFHTRFTHSHTHTHSHTQPQPHIATHSHTHTQPAVRTSNTDASGRQCSSSVVRVVSTAAWVSMVSTESRAGSVGLALAPPPRLAASLPKRLHVSAMNVRNVTSA